jgi:hypothetical protein
MRLLSAVICDHAGVREGLLTVVAAGITRIHREKLPGPLSVFVAVLVEVPPVDRPFPHELSVRLTSPSGKQLLKGGAGFQVQPGPDMDSDESSLVPLPIDMRNVGVEEYGWHEVAISLDSADPITLRFKVAQRLPQRRQDAPMPASAQKLPH